MKILALSDQVVDGVYNTKMPERLHEIDLIVGCGDLPSDYLEYVVSKLNVPMVYVPRNHDPDQYEVPGGIAIDGKLVEICNSRIMGLGGSQRYKPAGMHQYTETEMTVRVMRLLISSFVKRPLRNREIDLFITHSPPSGIHDASDLPHRGFLTFHTIFNTLSPKVMLHGHSHVNRNIVCTETTISSTKIINVFPYRVIEFERLA